MREYYSYSIVLGDCKYTNESSISMDHSMLMSYQQALEDGWEPDPLREKWWQFWRSVDHNFVLNEALEMIREKILCQD